MAHRWYVVHAYSGFENKVAQSIREQAEKKGLVTRIVPDGEVEAEAMKAAERIAEGAPLVARWHKKFVRRLTRPEELSRAELDESFVCFGTEDFRIGYRSFLDKTKPAFKGR